MQAESTQEAQDRRKRKLKKTSKTKEPKTSLAEDDDSDLDLRRDLRPISSYMASRSAMVEEMFRAVRGPSLTRALPDLLKSVPLEELKALCVELYILYIQQGSVVNFLPPYFYKDDHIASLEGCYLFYQFQCKLWLLQLNFAIGFTSCPSLILV